MTRKYKLGSKLDMKHFEKDLMKKAHSLAEDTITSKDIEIECPHCHKKISVSKGLSYCPNCHATINTDIKVKWK